jgi:hypothetical protein
LYRIETFSGGKLLPYDKRVFNTSAEALAHGRVVMNLSERLPIIRNMKKDVYINPTRWKTIEEHFGKVTERTWPKEEAVGRQVAKFKAKYIAD